MKKNGINALKNHTYSLIEEGMFTLITRANNDPKANTVEELKTTSAFREMGWMTIVYI